MSRYNFEDLGPFVDDATALTFIRSMNWDTNEDGTGDPIAGMRYWRSSTNSRRQWDGAAWGDVGGGGATFEPFQFCLPLVQSNDTTRHAWVSADSTCIKIWAYLEVLPSAGALTLEVINKETGNTMLVGANFDLTTLAAGVVTELTLTGTPADLSFSEEGRFKVVVTADALMADAEGLYVGLKFET